MKRLLWPFIHCYKLRVTNIVAGSWGWTAPATVADLVNARSTTTKNESMGNRQVNVNVPPDFNTGAAIARNTIFEAAKMKDDFTADLLTAPKLSCALNYLNNLDIPRDSSWERSYSDSSLTVMSSYIEEGIARSNNHVLGLWPKQHIHHEIVTGAKGPEFASWDNTPLRQVVRVSFYFPHDDVYEIWEFQRQVVLCNHDYDGDWNVCNFNDILQEGEGFL